jgi:hypothetical protein
MSFLQTMLINHFYYICMLDRYKRAIKEIIIVNKPKSSPELKIFAVPEVVVWVEISATKQIDHILVLFLFLLNVTNR